LEETRRVEADVNLVDKLERQEYGRNRKSDLRKASLALVKLHEFYEYKYYSVFFVYRRFYGINF